MLCPYDAESLLSKLAVTMTTNTDYDSRKGAKTPR
jgi:hypothetical protein